MIYLLATAPLVLAFLYMLRGRARDYGIILIVARLLWAGAFGAYALLITNDWLIASQSVIGAFLANMIPYGYYAAMGLYTGNKQDWLHIPRQSFWWCFAAMALIGFLQGLAMFNGLGFGWALAVMLINPLTHIPFRPNLKRAELLYGFSIGLILLLIGAFYI